MYVYSKQNKVFSVFFFSQFFQKFTDGDLFTNIIFDLSRRKSNIWAFTLTKYTLLLHSPSYVDIHILIENTKMIRPSLYILKPPKKIAS